MYVEVDYMNAIYFLIWLNITLFLFLLLHVIEEKMAFAFLLLSAIGAFCFVQFLEWAGFIFFMR